MQATSTTARPVELQHGNSSRATQRRWRHEMVALYLLFMEASTYALLAVRSGDDSGAYTGVTIAYVLAVAIVACRRPWWRTPS